MKKEVMRKYISAIISLGTLLILFYTIIDLKQQVKQIDVLQFKLDSVTVKADILYDRNYSIDVENAKFRGALNYLKKNDPKDAEKFINIIRNEIK